MYIPGKGVYFQLISTCTNNRIFSRTSPDPKVGMTDGPEHDDQWFTLIYGTSSNNYAGQYAIKGKESKRVLFSRTADPHVSNVEGDGTYNDNWFTFEEGSNSHANEFRILCPATSLVIFSRKSSDPTFSNVSKDPVYDDHYFKFNFEDMVVEKVDFDVNSGVIVTQTPEVIAEQVLRNNSGNEQEMSFTFSSNVSQTSSFEYGVGFTIGAKTEFKTGIPFIVEGKIEVSASVTNEWKFGSSETFSKNYGANFNVKAGAHSSVHAKATVHKANLTVPYTITLYPKRDRSVKVQTKGNWKGLTTWNLAYQIDNAV